MVARLPSAMLPLAVLLLVVETGGSIAAAGLTAGAFSIGRAAASPFVGALIDRFGQARVLLAGALAQTFALAALVGVSDLRAPLLAVVMVAVVAGAASPPVQACLRALWALAVAPPMRDAAYSLDATTQELIWIAGPLAVAAILAAGSAGLAVGAGAVIGVAGVAWFVSSPVSRRAPRTAGPGRFALSAAGSAPLRQLIAISVCTGFAWGAISFGLSALAVESGDRQGAGILLAALSLGSIAGGLVYGSHTWRTGVMTRLRAVLALSGGATVPLLLVRSVAQAAPLGLLAGLPLAPIYAATYALTGRAVPAGATTEAFAWTSSAFALGVALGTSAGGAAAEAAGARGAFALACAASLAAVGLTYLPARALRPAGGDPAGATAPLPPPASG
jgi:MFS family permease